MERTDPRTMSPTFYDLARHNRRAVWLLGLVAGGTLGLPLLGIGLFLATLTSGPEGGPYATTFPTALPVAAVAAVIVALGRLAWLLSRRDESDVTLRRAGGELLDPSAARWLADPVAEIALAAGIETPRIARLPDRGIAVVGFGSGERMIVAATPDAMLLPDDERRAIVAYTIGFLLAEGAGLTRLVRATSGVFDPLRVIKIVYAIAVAGVAFLELGALVLAATHGQLTPGAFVGVLSGLIVIPPVLTGATLLFIGITFTVTAVIRSFVAAGLEDTTAGLADALAVELNRDPEALASLLGDRLRGRWPQATLDDRGLALSSALGHEFIDETIKARIERLRALTGTVTGE